MLAGIAAVVEADYVKPEDVPWVGSPFEWILSKPSRTKGAIAEKLIAEWATAKGCDVTRSGTSDFDRLINGHRVEIKLSTRWASGIYKFQQIRDQGYDYLICLGIAPFDAYMFCLPKPLLLEQVIGQMGQHTGAGGRDTAWLEFRPWAPLAWMEEYGGTLAQGWAVFESLGYGPY